MTRDEAVAAIRDALAERMREVTNTAGMGVEGFKVAVLQAIDRCLEGVDQWDGAPAWREGLASVLLYSWTGIPEGADPKAALRLVPTTVLDRLVDGMGQGIAPLLWLEQGVRRGTIADWTFARESSELAHVQFTPALPVDYITMDFEVGGTDE